MTLRKPPRLFRSALAVAVSLALLAAAAEPAAAQASGGDPSPSVGEHASDTGDGADAAGDAGDAVDDLLPDSPLDPGGSLAPDPGAGYSSDEVAYPNLGSQLSALAVAHDCLAASGDASDAGASCGAASPALPGGANSTLSTEPLLLTMQLDGNGDGVLEFLADNGVTTANVVGDYLEAYVPPGLLGALAGQTGVSRVREMPQPFKDRGRITGDAFKEHEADLWHFNGFTGDGVKVGVIDGSRTNTSKDGFTGLRARLGTDLPKTVVGRCYTGTGKPTSDLANCDTAGGDTHGTKVAESLMDIAPDAELYISNARTWADLHSAVVWMHGQGVKVIAYSTSWSFHGAADGTSPEKVSPLNPAKWAADNGIVWVNSAGNYTQKAWYGAFADSDNDGYHEWARTGSTVDEAQMFEVSEPGGAFFTMRWDDPWGGAAKDLDLEVRYSATSDGAQTVVATSADLQRGGKGDYQLENLMLSMPRAGFYWVHAKKKAASAAPSWVQIMTFSPLLLEHHTSGGSITSPGDSSAPEVLAVGAARQTDWTDPDSYAVHPRSGRGPTPDGRTKPDIVGIHCGPTTFGGFCGTSQAAPHVAGLAALVLERNPTFTARQVARYLETNAVDSGTAGADNTWGHGLAMLPATGLTTPEEYCATTALTGSGSVQGTWDRYCSEEGDDDRPARYYSFALSQQSSVTIELTSAIRVNTRLFLTRGGDARRGKSLETGQVSGRVGKPARIEMDLPAGDYTITAAPFDVNPFTEDHLGPFTLAVQGIPTLVTSGSEISIAPGAAVTEGSDAVFTVSANPAPKAPLTVWVEVAHQGVFGVMSNWSKCRSDWVDHNGRCLQPVTVSTAGSGSLAVPTVGDSTDEADGSVTVTVDPSPRYTVSSSAGSATVAVSDDDDPLPQPVEGDACVVALTGNGGFGAEWSSACGSVDHSGRQARFYTFTLSSRSTVTIDLTRAGPHGTRLYVRSGLGKKTGSSLAPAKDDCDRSRGYASCPWRRTNRIRTSLPAGDYTIEAAPIEAVPSTASKWNAGTGPFALTVSGLSEQPMNAGTMVSVAAVSASVTEGSSASFTVSASPAPTAPLAVSVAVSQQGDYAASGTTGTKTVTIPSDGSVTHAVATVNDGADEADGSVTVTLGAGSGYTISGTQASAWVAVADDDDPPKKQTPPPTNVCKTTDTALLARVAAKTTDSWGGTRPDLVETFTRVHHTMQGADDCTVADIKARPDRQQANWQGAGPNDLWQKIYKELDRLQACRATPTPDTPPPPATPEVSVTAGSGVTEGGAASFTVTASPVPTAPLAVSVTVSQAGDWGATVGKRTVAVGTTGTAKLTVSTADDGADEADGSVAVTLDAGTGYTVSSAHGAASVAVADDDVPVVSVTAGAGVSEGGAAVFTVTADPVPAVPLAVSVSVAQTGDYAAAGATGSKTVIVPTSGSRAFTVATVNDGADEADGSVAVTLDAGTGYTVSSAHGAASVAVADDDDAPEEQVPPVMVCKTTDAALLARVAAKGPS